MHLWFELIPFLLIFCQPAESVTPEPSPEKILQVVKNAQEITQQHLSDYITKSSILFAHLQQHHEDLLCSDDLEEMQDAITVLNQQSPIMHQMKECWNAQLFAASSASLESIRYEVSLLVHSKAKADVPKLKRALELDFKALVAYYEALKELGEVFPRKLVLAKSFLKLSPIFNK